MKFDKEQNILSKELHAPARKNYPKRKVVTLGINDLWQADIVDMSSLSSKNGGIRYILTVIDTFSKKAYAKPLKTKSGEEMTEVFADVLSDGIPRHLQTDEGKEFFNSKFQALMKKHNINHYNTYSYLKASVVERFNRTLKSRMWKEFTRLNTQKWIPMLQKLVDSYNDTYHRTIKMKPSQVKNNVDKVRNLLKVDKKENVDSKFKVGDIVRVSKAKGIFEKGYTFNWSEELFKVNTVKTSVPVSYVLVDMGDDPIKGTFYDQELKKTKIPDYARIDKIVQRKVHKGRKMVRVKWKGYDNKFNTWELAKDIEKL